MHAIGGQLAAAAAALLMAAPATAELVKEPKTDVTFAASVGDLSLVGVGVRTKTFLEDQLRKRIVSRANDLLG